MHVSTCKHEAKLSNIKTAVNFFQVFCVLSTANYCKTHFFCQLCSPNQCDDCAKIECTTYSSYTTHMVDNQCFMQTFIHRNHNAKFIFLIIRTLVCARNNVALFACFNRFLVRTACTTCVITQKQTDRALTKKLANVRLNINILKMLVCVCMEQSQCTVEPD